MFVVAQYLCKNTVEVEPVPKGWINNSFLMWPPPKSYNARMVKKMQTKSASKYEDDWVRHPTIIKGSFKTYKLAEDEANRLSEVPVTDDEATIKLLKDIRASLIMKGIYM